MEKQKKWVKTRHQVIRNFGAVLARIANGVWLHADIRPFREHGGRNWLILSNHQTPYDSLFVGLSFPRPVYCLTSDDLFSKKWVTALIRWLGEPIPIAKNTADFKAIQNCIQVAREGGSIAVFPEGNRTCSGKTEYMKPTIAAMAKMLKLPIALYRIEGGFGLQPRWGRWIRRGKVTASVCRTIEPEEYAEYSDEQLFAVIREGLAVNDCLAEGNRYRSGRRAEYLERAAYVCPWCGLTAFRSQGNRIRCETCGREIEYGEDLRLKGVGYDFPFATYSDWYDDQTAFVRSLDLQAYTETPVFRDTADLYQVVQRQRKLRRRGAALALYGDRITVDERGKQPFTLSFQDITAASVLGKNKLNLFLGRKVYQIKSDVRFNAVKYVNFYYRYRIMTGSSKDGQFLGL